jgi:glycerophosphoryl diester phosphodiesterase
MVKYIAHRGFGKGKKENTLSAFQYSADSEAYGVETDVRITKDGVFVAFHDKSAARISGRYKIVEKTEFRVLQKLKIYDRHRRHKIAIFLEFLQNCKVSGKIAIVEIKSDLTKEQTEKLIEEIKAEDYLSKTVFISFKVHVLCYIRELLHEQPIQLLMRKYKHEYLNICGEHKFGIDIYHKQLSKDRVDECHSHGIEVNCWTVNKRKRAELLQWWGVDYITTDILALCERKEERS